MDKLPEALLMFQWLEEALRQYITRTELMLATIASPLMHYEPNLKRLGNDSFGRLVGRFRQRNANTDLQSALSKLVNERNTYAHRGYLLLNAAKEDPDTLRQALQSLDHALAAAETCLQRLTEEITALERRFVALQCPVSAVAPAPRQRGRKNGAGAGYTGTPRPAKEARSTR